MRTIFLAVTGLSIAVTACSDGGTSVVVVQKTPVASVVISLPTSALMVGQTAHGTATARDASGVALSDRPIAWRSSNAGIATVDGTGTIAGVAPGNATISAESEGVSSAASLTVMDAPPAAVASVSVALAASSVIPGQTTQATATLRDASNNPLSGRAVTWTSSNNAVATVNGSGVVTAVAEGTAQITATSESKSGSATLTVTAAPPVAVASVSVSLASSSLNPGQTTQATATTRDASNNVLTGRSISWSSSNNGVATVSASGLVTAVAAGTAQIIATSETKTGNATLTVAAPPPAPVASVSVTLAASSRNPGQTTQATATLRDANNNILTGRTIVWSSSDNGVATVSTSGLVTAIAVGTATIMASCEGQSGTSTITVTNPAPAPVATVTVSLGSSTLVPGATTQATATTRDANNNVLTGRSISWSTSDNTLATVSQTGLVTAVAVGNVDIRATSEGQTGSAAVGIELAVPPPSGSNEPSGMSTITNRAFNAIDEDPIWEDYNSPHIAQDATAPVSAPNIWRATYPAGFVAGTSPDAAWLYIPRHRTVYVSVWFRYSSNWVGHETGVNKQFYVWTNGNAPSVVFYADGAGNNPLVPSVTIQDCIVPRSDELHRSPNLVPSARIIRGRWHHLEAVLVGNTSGNANGSLDWYLDGVHIGSYSGIQYISGNALWGDVNVAPVWGGIGGPNVPATQTWDIDQFYMSGKN